jgi:hypothetical protein
LKKRGLEREQTRGGGKIKARRGRKDEKGKMRGRGEKKTGDRGV